MRKMGFMNAEVTTFIDTLAHDWQKAIAVQIRDAIHANIADVEERLMYSKPHYLKNRKYLAVITPAKGWVAYTIFNMEAVDAPSDLFETSTNGDRKTIKIKPSHAVDIELLTRLTVAAASTL
jgi:hypothetical protein